MKGILVPVHDPEDRRATLEGMGVEVADTINAFENRVLLFDDLGRAALVDGLANAEGATVINGEEAEELRKLANPKPRSMSSRQALEYRAGYNRIVSDRLLGKYNAAAHKAWVTMFEWRAAINRGEFTHGVSVTFEVAGQRTTVEDKAVSVKHAEALIRKIRREQRKKLGGAEVAVTKSIFPIQASVSVRSRARVLGRRRASV